MYINSVWPIKTCDGQSRHVMAISQAYMQALMESEVRRDSLVKDTEGWGMPLVEPGRLVGRMAWHAAKFLSHSPLRAEVEQWWRT